MARKSSKTAHVLSLLAGHEEKKETDSTTSSAPVDTTNVSIVDNSQKDDVEDLIQSKLLDEFGKELFSEETETSKASVPEPVSETLEDLEISAPEPASESPEVLEIPVSESIPVPESIPEPVSKPQEVPETTAPESVSEEKEEKKQEEPVDFAYINIVEKIVRDKIIYYMRQFDCCTCDRCIADTVALTLNGLPPKYIVADPSAEAPLISYYTNKFISDITVEATKACMTIKENPRHKK